MTIKPEQMTAYDDAAKLIRATADKLDSEVNLVRFNQDHRDRFAKVLGELRHLGADLFRESYDVFLMARGFKEAT